MTVWVTGNAPRNLTRELMAAIGADKGQNDRRGLKVDEHMRVVGAENIWALGDCSISKYPATAQVASQQGAYLGRLFNNLSNEMNEQLHARSQKAAFVDEAEPFQFYNFGKFAYIGDAPHSPRPFQKNSWIYFLYRTQRGDCRA